MFEDLGTSLRQLPHNTACADGRLVTPITPPATGRLIAPKRFVGMRIRIARTQNRKSKRIFIIKTTVVAIDATDADYCIPLGALRRQLLQQRLRLLQIERVEAFRKPPVDRSEQFASLLRLTLIARRSLA